MPIRMAGIEVNAASVSVREAFAFSDREIRRILREICQKQGVCGCVLLVTCNRTELYLSVETTCTENPEQLLYRYASVKTEREFLTIRQEQDAILHLMEVACGLHSQILHEEQIAAQVGQAVALAREIQTADPQLDTLFRIAASAGKAALTEIPASPSVPDSVASAAVHKLEQSDANLHGKTCLVIGNGKMGRLAAKLLLYRGCTVYVTLRSHHCRESVVPFGMIPVPYETRFSVMEKADVVVSATRSPHYTITALQLGALQRKPLWILDLAMPRDVEEACGQIPGVHCWNLDDFGILEESDQKTVQALRRIAEKYAADFQLWQNYRCAVPYMRQLKVLTAERLLHSTALDAYRTQPDLEELVRLVTEKTVDMLMGGMKPAVTPELLEDCCEKLKSRLY